MLKQYFKARLQSKYTIAIVFLLIFYTVIACFDVNILAHSSTMVYAKFYEANYSSFFSIYSTPGIIAPLYFIFIQPNRLFFDRHCVIVRFKNERNYHRSRMLVNVIESAGFVLFLYLLMFLRSAYFGVVPSFFENGLLYLQCALLQIVGYLLLGMIFNFFTSLSTHAILGFACAYFFVIYDFAITISNIRIPTLFVGRSIEVNLLDLSGYGINLFIMIVAVVFFYHFINICLSQRDRLPKKVN